MHKQYKIFAINESLVYLGTFIFKEVYYTPDMINVIILLSFIFQFFDSRCQRTGQQDSH